MLFTKNVCHSNRIKSRLNSGGIPAPKHDREEFALSCLFVCFSALFSCIVSYYLCQIVIDHVSQFCSSLLIVFNGFVGG